MEMLYFLTLVIGIAGGVMATLYFFRTKNKRQIQLQSQLLLEKIRQVCKLITVESEFSELFTYREDRKRFFNLIPSEKKALVIIRAKVLVGFDLAKINIDIHKEKRQVALSRFPAPEIMSIETDLEYFDLQKGMIHKFSESELTSLQKNAKEFIREKALGSHIMEIARRQSEETISIIRQLIGSVGWELVPDVIPGTGQKILEDRKLSKQIEKT